MNPRFESPGRSRPNHWSPQSFAVALSLAFAGLTLSTGHAAADSAAILPSTAQADITVAATTLQSVPVAQTVDAVAGTPSGVSLDGGRSLTGAAGAMTDLVDGGFEPLPGGGAATQGGAVADPEGTAATYAPYVERAWTTDRYGRPQTQFAQGDGMRLYFTAVNPAWNWQVAYLRLAARMDIVCIQAPCIAPESVLLQGYKWFPPGRATYYLPVLIERTDTVGNWLFEARVGETAALARFTIAEGGVNTPPSLNGVLFYDGAEYTGRSVAVGAGTTQLPNGFQPRSLRFSGAYAAGWQADLYHTICPFVPPCFSQFFAAYRSDQADLGSVGTGPYRVSVHR